jgi:RNA polymerase sigma-70 factor (ECF subfamily)
MLSEEALGFLAEAAVEHGPEIDRRYRFLMECIEAVKGEARRILEMKYAEGLKAADIAGRIGRRVEAVEMMLVRIRRALRDCIDRKAARAVRET